jgi:hypothetical protein
VDTDEAVFRAAADKLSDLYQATKHIPLPLTHSEDVRGRVDCTDGRGPVAMAFWGGLADLVVALGPDVLSPLAFVMEDAARASWSASTPERKNLLTLARAILKES